MSALPVPTEEEILDAQSQLEDWLAVLPLRDPRSIARAVSVLRWHLDSVQSDLEELREAVCAVVEGPALERIGVLVAANEGSHSVRAAAGSS